MAERPSSRAVELLHADLSQVLERAEKILRHYGVGHWRLTLVARNPDPGKAGEWTCVTSDEPDAVALTLLQPDRTVRG